MTTDLAPAVLPGLTRTAWQPPVDFSFEDWMKAGETLQAMEHSIQWWLGDWLNYGEQQSWGEKYTQALEASEYAYSTLRDFAWVASAIPVSVRRDNLSWAHHREVARLDVADQELWLQKATLGSMSRLALRAAVQESLGQPTSRAMTSLRDQVDALKAEVVDVKAQNSTVLQERNDFLTAVGAFDYEAALDKLALADQQAIVDTTLAHTEAKPPPEPSQPPTELSAYELYLLAIIRKLVTTLSGYHLDDAEYIVKEEAEAELLKH